VRTDGPTLISALVLAVLLPIAALALSPAQDSEDPRFKKAQEFWENAKTPGNLENACQIMTDLLKEKDSDFYRRFQKAYCRSAKDQRETEEDVYRKGKQAADNGECDKAEGLYEQIKQAWTKDPQYRDGLKQMVAICQSRAEAKRQEQEKLQKQSQEQEEEKRWADCLASEQADKYDDAQTCFEQLRNAGGSKASEASHHLAKLSSLRQEDEAYKEGVDFYNNHNRVAAGAVFQKVTKMGGSHLADAKRYLDLISQEEKKSSTDDFLRSGLRSYFESDFPQAERYLNDYLSKGGQKQWMAYFFLGAAHGAQYFLSQDSNEMKQAKDGFLKAQSRVKQTSSKDEMLRAQRSVSPRIWELYSKLQ